MNRKLNRKKVLYLIFLTIDIALLCFTLVLIYDHLNINKRRRDSYVSSYQESSKVTYQVNTLENAYVTNETFGNRNSYILKYTDNILFNFFYNYTSSNNITTKAYYEIIANVSASYKKSTNDSNEIYNKNIVLESGEVTSTQNTIYLEQQAKINLNDYNDILKGLQEDIKLPLIGNLNIYLKIDTKDENGIPIDTYKQDASVTLLSDIYEINTSNQEPSVKNFYNDNLEINYIYLTILGFIFVTLATIAMILIKKILKKNLTKGRIEANKYLRTYDDFIVNINDSFNEDKYEVVNIKEFKELLTLANNNVTSILYLEQKNKGLFYVQLNNYLYKFEIDYRS